MTLFPYDKTMKQLERHEGFRSRPYRCTAGKLTIGYGRNLDDVGIFEDEAGYMLFNDTEKAVESAKEIFLEFRSFSENRKIALVDMIFNLGVTKFMGFKKMIAAVQSKDWETAANEAVNSKWYEQVGSRAVTVISQLRNG